MRKLLVIFVLLLALTSAFAERKALVIANSKYDKVSLNSPLADADSMQTALRLMGFNVTRFNNLTLPKMIAAIDTFSVHLKATDNVVVYYSGLGTSSKELNYLVPAGENLSVIGEKNVFYSVNTLATKTKKAKTSILILEASRPWSPTGGKSTSHPFVAMVSAAPNQAILFAAQPGKSIQNANLANSLFTETLLKQISSSDLGFNVLFGKMATAINLSTRTAQKPWMSNNLAEDFFFIDNQIKGMWKGINPMHIEGGGSISW
ncbi:MAG: caspase family protein [Candidatus Cloacimonas sp.]|jgi:uncharacterized caspase-like protein|nr:caspase family protein [Candidatus Cloacimonas sp.]